VRVLTRSSRALLEAVWQAALKASPFAIFHTPHLGGGRVADHVFNHEPRSSSASKAVEEMRENYRPDAIFWRSG